MCVAKLLEMFHPRAPVIPHPQEPMNPTATLETTSIASITKKWLDAWEVPEDHRSRWWLWPVLVKDNLTYLGNFYPALTWSDRTEIDVKWANPGVLAHEICHVVWAELEEAQKAEFNIAYGAAMANDRLLQLMVRTYSYSLTSYMEAHAEVYRFLGQKMPVQLREYYPTLL